MRPDSTEKVLERLATSDKVTIVVERLLNGNMHVTSGSWDNEKVILHDEMIEVRNVNHRLHIARKPGRHDEWDPCVRPTIRMVQARQRERSRSDEFIDD